MLEVGNKAPGFSLKDQDGNTVSLKDFKGKKVLVYFYPKADTPGCTTQACSIRDTKEVFDNIGLIRLGMSPDGPSKQKKFVDKYNLDFPLLCDEDHKVAEAYGAWGEKKNFGKTYDGIIRSSFLIDGEGKIEQVWYKVSPKDTVPNALKALGV